MSLRLRLLVAVGLVALTALVVADVATYSALRSFLYARIDQSLLETAGRIPPHVGSHFAPQAPLFGHPPPEDQGPYGQGGRFNYGAGYSLEVRTDGRVSSLPANEPGGHRYYPDLTPADLRTQVPKSGQTSTFLTTGSTVKDGPQFRVLVTTYPDGDQLILGQPLDSTAATLHRLAYIELAVTAAALLAALLLGVWLVRVGLQPLQEMEETAEAIADGDLSRRIPGEEARTEVGRLARVLNLMLARIQRAFAERDATEAELRHSEERMRRFVADASHELRTPLAAVAAYAELYGRGAASHPEDLDRVMKGIVGESDRMKRLVDDLFLLARLDEGRPLEQRPLELVSIASDAVHAATAVGPDYPVTLVADHPVEMVGDSGRLRQVFDNVLANVRSHTPPGTRTEVRISSSGSVATIEVADDGPGIRPEDAVRVFERFYRADPSRSRTSGGSGLGLSIVSAIVDAHRGRVVAAPRAGGGTVITVTLPVSSAQGDGDQARGTKGQGREPVTGSNGAPTAAGRHAPDSAEAPAPASVEAPAPAPAGAGGGSGRRVGS